MEACAKGIQVTGIIRAIETENYVLWLCMAQNSSQRESTEYVQISGGINNLTNGGITVQFIEVHHMIFTKIHRECTKPKSEE